MQNFSHGWRFLCLLSKTRGTTDLQFLETEINLKLKNRICLNHMTTVTVARSRLYLSPHELHQLFCFFLTLVLLKGVLNPIMFVNEHSPKTCAHNMLSHKARDINTPHTPLFPLRAEEKLQYFQTIHIIAKLLSKCLNFLNINLYSSAYAQCSSNNISLLISLLVQLLIHWS